MKDRLALEKLWRDVVHWDRTLGPYFSSLEASFTTGKIRSHGAVPKHARLFPTAHPPGPSVFWGCYFLRTTTIHSPHIITLIKSAPFPPTQPIDKSTFEVWGFLILDSDRAMGTGESSSSLEFTDSAKYWPFGRSSPRFRRVEYLQ